MFLNVLLLQQFELHLQVLDLVLQAADVLLLDSLSLGLILEAIDLGSEVRRGGGIIEAFDLAMHGRGHLLDRQRVGQVE